MSMEVTVVRIYLHEADHGRRRNLMQEILNLLHDQQRVKAVTVFRGIAGMGDGGEVHASDILRIMVDLPLVIEFFDEPKVVEAILTLIEDRIPAGHIVSWTANCR
jgi:PII-like signaling protein